MLRITGITQPDGMATAEAVTDFLKVLVAKLGMRILAGPTVGYEDAAPEISGHSGVVILYESHAAIHTYPALREAFIDVFSCRPFELETVIEVLQQYYGDFQIKEQTVLDRGLHWSANLSQEQAQWVQTR